MTIENTLSNLEIELRKVNKKLAKADGKLKEIKDFQLNTIATKE